MQSLQSEAEAHDEYHQTPKLYGKSPTDMKTIITVSAILASVLCFLGGILILRHVDFSSKDDAIWGGIGLYFVGKAFFVGPMLWLTLQKRNETEA